MNELSVHERLSDTSATRLSLRRKLSELMLTIVEWWRMRSRGEHSVAGEGATPAAERQVRRENLEPRSNEPSCFTTELGFDAKPRFAVVALARRNRTFLFHHHHHFDAKPAVGSSSSAGGS